ncbi:MAG: Fic family protein [Deltaproteobacteria bacterium]|nr:Fic family protein [Deltaproteobacteria bacterium]
MKSFEDDFLQRHPINQTLIKTIRLLGEFRGKEDLFRVQSPQTLETLRQNAVIQSTESSNRIEGVVLQDYRQLKALVESKIQPITRPQQEIAGYRDVLQTIHDSHADIPHTARIVLQLHRDLFKYTAAPGGTWKNTDNAITETAADGTRTVRFQPVSAWQTPSAMEALHEQFRRALEPPNSVEPLIALGAYILDFLCIHPFLDGNGRIARLLTLLMLYQAGFNVGRYSSLEKVVEDTKDGYYDALYKSSQGWHDGKHDLTPWLEYFLGVMLLTAYREFENRVGSVETAKGAKAAIVIAAIERLPVRFTIGDVAKKCPTVGIDHVRKILRAERDAGRLVAEGRGPNAGWVKKSE